MIRRVSVSNWANTKAKELFYELIKHLGEPLHYSNKPGGFVMWKCSKRSIFEKHVIHDEIVHHAYPDVHQDCITSYLKFYIPTKKLSNVLGLAGCLGYDTLKHELSVRCEDLKSNIIATFICMALVENLIPWKEFKKKDIHFCKLKSKNKIDANQMLKEIYQIQQQNLKKYQSIMMYHGSDTEYATIQKHIQDSMVVRFDELDKANTVLQKSTVLKKLTDLLE